MRAVPNIRVGKMKNLMIIFKPNVSLETPTYYKTKYIPPSKIKLFDESKTPKRLDDSEISISKPQTPISLNKLNNIKHWQDDKNTKVTKN